jgi:hypothetical protein
MAKVTSPEEFFGHRLGADRKIARWDKIVEYFNKIETVSSSAVRKILGTLSVLMRSTNRLLIPII